MFYEIVAVVYYGIVVARYIVLVVIANLEQSYIAQVARGHAGDAGKIASYLSEQNSTIGQGLKLIQDASDRVDGIGSTVQVVLVGIDNLVRLLLKEIRTRGY
jgi:hypothetical protein